MWQCGNVSTRGDACGERAAARSGSPLVAYCLAPVLAYLLGMSADIYISSGLEILANQGYKPNSLPNFLHPSFASTLPPTCIPLASPALIQRHNSNVPNTLCRRIPSLPLTPSRTEEDAMDRALHGSCACGRNRYIVEIPAGSAQLAELTYDNSSAARKSKFSSAS